MIAVEPVEVKTKKSDVRPGFMWVRVLDSPLCDACGPDAEDQDDSYPLVEVAARVRVSGYTGELCPTDLCRSHALMLLGEQRVTEALKG